jgi:hypothetical protein
MPIQPPVECKDGKIIDRLTEKLAAIENTLFYPREVAVYDIAEALERLEREYQLKTKIPFEEDSVEVTVSLGIQTKTFKIIIKEA